MSYCLSIVIISSKKIVDISKETVQSSSHTLSLFSLQQSCKVGHYDDDDDDDFRIISRSRSTYSLLQQLRLDVTRVWVMAATSFFLGRVTTTGKPAEAEQSCSWQGNPCYLDIPEQHRVQEHLPTTNMGFLGEYKSIQHHSSPTSQSPSTKLQLVRLHPTFKH